MKDSEQQKCPARLQKLSWTLLLSPPPRGIPQLTTEPSWAIGLIHWMIQVILLLLLLILLFFTIFYLYLLFLKQNSFISTSTTLVLPGKWSETCSLWSFVARCYMENPNIYWGTYQNLLQAPGSIMSQSPFWLWASPFQRHSSRHPRRRRQSFLSAAKATDELAIFVTSCSWLCTALPKTKWLKIKSKILFTSDSGEFWMSCYKMSFNLDLDSTKVVSN